MVNGAPADTAVLTNGNTTITFHFNTSPAVQGQNTTHIPVGAFDCGNGGGTRIHLHVLFRGEETHADFSPSHIPDRE